MKPLLSVIIPCYKVEAYIGACLQSVWDAVSPENRSAVELVVVDDGTPDNTPAIVQSFLDGRVSGSGMGAVCARQQDAGSADARNSGMRRAAGQYWFFLDSDDVLFPGAVDRMLDIIRRTQPDIVEFDARMFADGSDPAASDRPSLYARYFRDVAEHKLEGEAKMLRAFEECRWYVWSRCYRRELFDGERFEAGRLFEDMMTVPYLYLNRARIESLPEVLVGYRQNAGSITANMSRRHLDDIFYSLQKTLKRIAGFSGSSTDLSALHILKLKSWRLIVAYSVKRSLKSGNPSWLAAVRRYRRILKSECQTDLDWQTAYFTRVLVQRLREKLLRKAA